jgi:hypothetical protein
MCLKGLGIKNKRLSSAFFCSEDVVGTKEESSNILTKSLFLLFLL